MHEDGGLGVSPLRRSGPDVDLADVELDGRAGPVRDRYGSELIGHQAIILAGSPPDIWRIPPVNALVAGRAAACGPDRPAGC